MDRVQLLMLVVEKANMRMCVDSKINEISGEQNRYLRGHTHRGEGLDFLLTESGTKHALGW